MDSRKTGEKIGVTVSSITNYEKDNSHPKKPVMYALINALDVDANFLFQDCINTIKRSEWPNLSNPQLSRIVHIYEELNDEGRRRLSEYAEYLFDNGKYLKSDNIRSASKRA